MGALTPYLQQAFSRCCPGGWTCRHEVRVLSSELEAILGYRPRVDVLLEREDGWRRLWIEFEVSSADPVANHTKFATAHLKRQIMGREVVVTVTEGCLDFGHWEQIFYGEFDSGRQETRPGQDYRCVKRAPACPAAAPNLHDNTGPAASSVLDAAKAEPAVPKRLRVHRIGSTFPG